jgi:hypothetical protein
MYLAEVIAGDDLGSEGLKDLKSFFGGIEPAGIGPQVGLTYKWVSTEAHCRNDRTLN